MKKKRTRRRHKSENNTIDIVRGVAVELFGPLGMPMVDALHAQLLKTDPHRQHWNLHSMLHAVYSPEDVEALYAGLDDRWGTRPSAQVVVHDLAAVIFIGLVECLGFPKGYCPKPAELAAKLTETNR